MTELIEKSKRVLEFNKIISMLKDNIVSDLAKDLADKEDISKDIREINLRLDETTEAVNLIIKKSNPPLFGIMDIKPYMKRLEMGGSLGPEELLNISDFLRVSRYLKSYFSIDPKDPSYKLLPYKAENLSSYKNIEDSINDAIISPEEISDNASPRLYSIRQQIGRKKDAIRDKLNYIISSEETKKYIQDSLVTIREGRYVVPVKLESKSKLKGLIHDRSSSGQTVYIEPMAVVNLNNELKNLYSDELEEINRILRELSQMVAEESYAIAANQNILAELDFIFAKAKLSLELNCNRPLVNEKRYINLKKARHPLLKAENIVPIDIHIGDDFTSLIITGPNTGGKTVSIKTLGLLVLMTQYGLHIPALENSEIGIFDKVLADIGDEQSIEQSLSTFSSHMLNIVEILKYADSKSLVIFDELGAGTDPTEGAALANAIMDYMRVNNIISLATTHYNQLKIYALTTENVANASMEFNVDTLSPTYKLLIGVPGKSNAFEISKRLGLSEEIISKARELISKENIEFEEVLKSIEEERTLIEENKLISERERKNFEEKSKKLEDEIAKTKAKREKILESSREEAKQMLLNARENIKLIMDEIKSLKTELNSDQARRLQDVNDILRDNISDALKPSEKIVIKKASDPIMDLKIGDSVRSPSLNAEGTIIDIDKNGKDVLVQIGMIKMKLPKNSLERSTRDEDKEKEKSKRIMNSKSKYIKTEVDIRGKTFDEAKPIIEKYLDDAYLAGLKQVRLIHGKGTGALREKVKAYLKKNPNIKSAKDAAYNEGGSGVSIVEFK
ncbi:endonuclease MutS2 [Peptoniphilus catoniae]|uniref:endonuclease MutS2 n=1 Tax=Peptoniphilus catoniae TaxID=1660341 RepID=UPI0010FE10E3|nr:endonuclease MutS2 [Peptoniphilus catoniae]